MNIGTITITVYLDDNGEEMTSVSVTGDHFPLINPARRDRPGTGFAAATGGGLMSAVEWADPPNLPPSRNRTEEAIEELKLHPGAWAIVATGQTSSSDAEKWQQHGVETTTRRERSGWITVYARWPKEAKK